MISEHIFYSQMWITKKGLTTFPKMQVIGL